MDIAALSTSMSQASLSQAVGIRVLALAKNQAEEQSQGMITMLANLPHPNLGKNIDIKA